MESADGLTKWTAYRTIQSICPAYFPNCDEVGSTYYMFSNNGETPLRIQLSHLKMDGIAWTLANAECSRGGAGGQWTLISSRKLDFVFFDGTTYYAYYQGGNGGAIFASGLATSTDFSALG